MNKYKSISNLCNGHCTKEAESFMMKVLEYVPALRIDINGMRNHIWLKHYYRTRHDIKSKTQIDLDFLNDDILNDYEGCKNVMFETIRCIYDTIPLKRQ